MRHHLVGLGIAHLRSFKSRSVNNSDGIPSKVNPDMMLNEKGLRSEWSNHPELYEGD